MEDFERGFTQISLEVAGAQLGKFRYPRSAAGDAGGNVVPPSTGRYRNNLTALSQYHNLYFVAYVDQIYVYQPQFPDQMLGLEPNLILKPPRSGTGLRGFIDTECPHAINHMLVDDLGDEEVLACACDDGDVVLYYTRAIASRVKDQSDPGFAEAQPDEQVKIFFVDNVGQSAWGLAIHKAGRMLAISSNTTCIDVIAFGLCSPERPSSGESSEGGMEELAKEDQPTAPTPGNDRGFEFRIQLTGHGVNIPSIAFCNNQYDPDGRWLASTDINGVLLVWNIWAREIVARYPFGDESPHRLPAHPDFERKRGWGVLCLDRSTFTITEGPLETFGCRRVYGKPVDITSSRFDLKDPSSRFGYQLMPDVHGPEGGPPPGGDEDDDMADDDPDGDGSAEENDESEEDEAEPGEATEDEDYNLDDLVDDSDAELAASGDGHESGSAVDSTSPPDHATNPDRAPPAGDVLVPFPSDPQPIPYPPRFSILHTTETNVRLLTTPFTGPTAICRNVLKQALSPGLQYLRHFERLNMVAQVPELNLVVIGCQTGRVALFTLTRAPPSEPAAFRLEFTLPFGSQEEEHLRPARPLLGLAIGPIQGREKAVDPHGLDETTTRRNRQQLWRKIEKTRRYRLMLTYHDHTVLSYEIGRVGRPVSDDPDGDLFAT